MVEDFVVKVVESTVRSMWHARWYIVLGIALSVAVSLLVERETVRRAMRRAGLGGVVGATALGVLSPLCSCSQIPVIAGLLAAGVPWSTVMPFMIASPMTSPLTFGLIAGYLGVKFAAFQMAAVAVLGLASGVAVLAGEQAGLLQDQSKLVPGVPPGCGCGRTAEPTAGRCSSAGSSADCCPSAERPAECYSSPGPSVTCCPGTASKAQSPAPPRREFVRQAWDLVLERSYSVIKILLIMGLVGGAIARLVPSSRILAWFGSGNRYSVPLAAAVGLPLQVSGAQVLPVLAQLAPKGLSAGAALAFLMTGPGTCFQALAATWAVARPRLFAVYVAFILVGSTLLGLACNLLMGPAF